MQVSVETTSGLERKMTVDIPAEKINVEAEKRLQQLARNVKLNGFRPGKIPFSVVKKRYGKDVRQEVMNEAMQQHFYQALVQEKINPAGAPYFELTNTQEGQDFQFVATFEVYPEITLNSLESVTIHKKQAQVEDNDLDNMLETLREQRADWKEVSRQAKNGDQVVIDFVGSIDGEEFAGGSAEEHALELGSGAMIPGSEDQLVDAQSGDEVELTVTFPGDYHAEELAGKEAVFATKVHKVNEKELPEIETLAGELGVEDNDIDKMKAEVRKNMERELSTAIKQNLKNQVMDALLNNNEVEVPKSAIDGEIEQLKKRAVAQYGGDEKMAASLPSDLFEQEATRRVKLGLLVGELISVRKIEASQEQIDAQLEEMATVYEQPAEVIQYYKADASRMSQVEQMVLEDLVVESVLGEVKLEEEQVSFDDIMNPKSEDSE